MSIGCGACLRISKQAWSGWTAVSHLPFPGLRNIAEFILNGPGNSSAAESPFGGIKDSGFGKESGKDVAINEYLITKTGTLTLEGQYWKGAPFKASGGLLGKIDPNSVANSAICLLNVVSFLGIWMLAKQRDEEETVKMWSGGSQTSPKKYQGIFN